MTFSDRPFSADELVRLLDEALLTDWQNVRMFANAVDGKTVTIVSMGMSNTHYTVDLLPPEARPSEKLFWLLQANLRKPACTENPQTVDNTSVDRMGGLLDDI